MSLAIQLTEVAANVAAIMPADAYCLPKNAQNALDTAKFWTAIAGGALAVIALMMVGVQIFMHNRRGDGTEIIKGIGYWILGVTVFAAAAGIASIFIPSAGNCVGA